MKKKLLSLILALAMVMSLAPLAFASAAKGLENFKKVNTYGDGKFTDISSGDWFKDVVASAYELGLMNGSSKITFNPNGNITVAETVALAARIHNIASGGDGEFEQGSPWYQVYVDYATEKKILRDTYKDLSAKISRANFAFILANALSAEDLEAINDVPDGSLPDVPDNYKASAIYTLYRAGVLTGSDEFGTFKPDSTITRAEVAAIVSRMADKTQRKKLSLQRKATVSAEIYRGALSYVNITMQQQYGMALSDYLDENAGYGMTGATMLKQQTMSLLTEFEAVRLFARENGITLKDAEKKEFLAPFVAAGEKASFEAAGINGAFYDYLKESQMYYAKAYELFGENGKFAVDTDGIGGILSENYIRVKHILIQASADDVEKKALANKVCRRIKGGEDFEKLLAEYGEDPGMISNPDGYIIDSKGFTPEGTQMIAEFTDASVALEVGGVSDVVTSAYGFHIIKRYPINEAFADSFIERNMGTFQENALANTFAAFAAKVTISNRAELEKIDLHEVFGK